MTGDIETCVSGEMRLLEPAFRRSPDAISLLVLLTYRTIRPGRSTLRSSVWW